MRWTTLVPRVFIGGEFIAGGNDTERVEGNGQLKKAGTLDNQIFLLSPKFVKQLWKCVFLSCQLN